MFRFGEAKGSKGGIGYEGHASTGAARLWMREGLEKPPSLGEIPGRSTLAARLGLAAEGFVAQRAGRTELLDALKTTD